MFTVGVATASKDSSYKNPANKKCSGINARTKRAKGFLKWMADCDTNLGKLFA